MLSRLGWVICNSVLSGGHTSCTSTPGDAVSKLEMYKLRAGTTGHLSLCGCQQAVRTGIRECTKWALLIFCHLCSLPVSPRLTALCIHVFVYKHRFLVPRQEVVVQPRDLYLQGQVVLQQPLYLPGQRAALGCIGAQLSQLHQDSTPNPSIPAEETHGARRSS